MTIADWKVRFHRWCCELRGGHRGGYADDGIEHCDGCDALRGFQENGPHTIYTAWFFRR